MTGTAYAFFDCRADTKEISLTIEDVTKTSPKGTLDTLVLDVRDIRDDATQALVEPGSDAHFQSAWDGGLPYVVKATSQERPSVEIAKDLGMLLNQLYNSPLYENDEEFRGEIAYDVGNGTYALYQQ